MSWIVRIAALAIFIIGLLLGIDANNEHQSNARQHIIDEGCNRRAAQGAYNEEFLLATNAVTEYCMTRGQGE